MSNLIHRIWLGGEMPGKYKDYGQIWQELNPEFKLIDWNEQMIFDRKWENQDVLDEMRKESKQDGADLIAYYTHVADVIDYELVFDYGGWYFNTDLKPLKPLDTLNQNMHTAAFAMEDDIHPVNMAMYAPPNHKLFELIIELLPERYFGMPGAFMNATTGVQLIMQALSVYPNKAKVKFYDRKVFNPIHWGDFGYGQEPDLNREYPPETVAVHEWLHRTNQRGQRVLEK